MKKYAVTALLFMLSVGTAVADETKLQDVWATVCTETQLNSSKIQEAVKIFTENKKLGVKEASEFLLQNTLSGAKTGWFIETTPEPTIVSYSEKQANGKFSRVCTVSRVVPSLVPLESWIEKEYKVDFVSHIPNGNKDSYIYKIYLENILLTTYVGTVYVDYYKNNLNISTESISLFSVE